jgi:hypothetical protein
MARLPSRTARRLKVCLQAERREALRQMMDDLQFLIGRPEEDSWIRDLFASVHYRREWVEEREQHELARMKHVAGFVLVVISPFLLL